MPLTIYKIKKLFKTTTKCFNFLLKLYFRDVILTKKSVTKCLSNLKYFDGYFFAITFGFVVYHVIHILPLTYIRLKVTFSENLLVDLL